MSPDARRRRRRRLLLAGLPVVIVSVAVQWKVAVMLGHDRDGRADYAAGSFADARDAFASNESVNVVQAWISPYDAGTARYRLDDFKGAVQALEDALSAAPSEEACRIRINLALAHEGLGDETVKDGDPLAGLEDWQDALDVLQKGGCVVLQEESPSGIGSATEAQVEDAKSVIERLREKMRSRDEVIAAVHPTAQDRAERLKERNEQARRDRRKLEEKKQDQMDALPLDPPGPGVPLHYEW